MSREYSHEFHHPINNAVQTVTPSMPPILLTSVDSMVDDIESFALATSRTAMRGHSRPALACELDPGMTSIDTSSDEQHPYLRYTMKYHCLREREDDGIFSASATHQSQAITSAPNCLSERDELRANRVLTKLSASGTVQTTAWGLVPPLGRLLEDPAAATAVVHRPRLKHYLYTISDDDDSDSASGYLSRGPVSSCSSPAHRCRDTHRRHHDRDDDARFFSQLQAKIDEGDERYRSMKVQEDLKVAQQRALKLAEAEAAEQQRRLQHGRDIGLMTAVWEGRHGVKGILARRIEDVIGAGGAEETDRDNLLTAETAAWGQLMEAEEQSVREITARYNYLKALAVQREMDDVEALLRLELFHNTSASPPSLANELKRDQSASSIGSDLDAEVRLAAEEERLEEERAAAEERRRLEEARKRDKSLFQRVKESCCCCTSQTNNLDDKIS